MNKSVNEFKLNDKLHFITSQNITNSESKQKISTDFENNNSTETEIFNTGYGLDVIDQETEKQQLKNIGFTDDDINRIYAAGKLSDSDITFIRKKSIQKMAIFTDEEIDRIISENSLTENDLEKIYKYNLKKIGFNDAEIQSLLSGEKTIDDLIVEIYSNRERLIEIGSVDVLQSSKYTSITDIQTEIDELKQNVWTKDRLIDKYQYSAAQRIIDKLNSGSTWEEAVETQIIYEEKSQRNQPNAITINFSIAGDNMTIAGNELHKNDQIYSYKDLYENTDIYNELYNIYNTYGANSNELNQYLTEIDAKKSEFLTEAKQSLKNWNSANEYNQNDGIELYTTSGSDDYIINEYNKLMFIQNDGTKTREIEALEKFKDNIYNETACYIDYVLTNMVDDDFEDNCNSKREKYGQIINQINFPTPKRQPDNSIADAWYTINGDEEKLAIIAATINSENYLTIDKDTGNVKKAEVNISSDDYLIKNIALYSSVMTEDEKQVFNYIYNTKGSNEVKAFLNGMSSVWDERWRIYKTETDKQYASNHPIEASVDSVFVKYIGGMNTFIDTTHKQLIGGQINNIDTYNQSSAYREGTKQILQNTALNGAWYDFLMGAFDVVLLAPTLEIPTSSIGGIIANAAYFTATVGTTTFQDSINAKLTSGSYTQNEAYFSALAEGVFTTIASTASVTHLKGSHEFATQTIGRYTEKVKSKFGKKAIWTLGISIEQGLFGSASFGASSTLSKATSYMINHGEEFDDAVYKKIESGMTEDEAIGSVLADNIGEIASDSGIALVANALVAIPFIGMKTVKTDVSVKPSQNTNDLKNAIDELNSQRTIEENIQETNIEEQTIDNSEIVEERYREVMKELRGGMNTLTYKILKDCLKRALKNEY